MTAPDQSQNVLAPPAMTAIFLVVTVRHGAEDDVRAFLPDVSSFVRAVGFRLPEDQLSCVVGIGSRLWDRLYGSPRPAGLHPFQPVVGATHTAPATPGDLLFHLRARRVDLCFELANQMTKRLDGRIDVVDEVHGFRYFDERDLLGFVDGTENPAGQKAVEAVLIGDEDPHFTGGSYVIVQKYLHDLDAWNALTVEQQEDAIGRHKLSDIEFPDADKPPNAHIRLNTIEDADGNQRQIVRDNLPFGQVGSREFGTYFIGYAADPDVTEQMLRNMFIGVPPGTHDRILDFSTAVTGALFFTPSAALLDDLPTAPPTGSAPEHGTDESAPDSAEAPHADGSLRIGGLRGDTP